LTIYGEDGTIFTVRARKTLAKKSRRKYIEKRRYRSGKILYFLEETWQLV
jgi:hypothetical protein